MRKFFADRGVLAEILATVAAAIVLLAMAAWSLSGLIASAHADGRRDRRSEPLSAPADAKRNERHEISVVRYEGPISRGASKNTVRLAELELRGLVRGSEDRSFRVEALCRRRKNALTEAIDVVMRTASPAELDDPENEVLKSRLADRIGRIVGADVIEEFYVTHCRIFETPSVAY